VSTGAGELGRCDACGEGVDPSWRHCAACGVRLVGGGPGEQGDDADRSTATVVVSDLQGSTALAERLDPESMRAALDRYFGVLGDVLEAFGGRIEKRIGDMMVTVFSTPAASAEDTADDAVRALRAVATCATALEELNEQLEAQWGVRLVNRTGVATGEVVTRAASGAHRLVSGRAIDTASALEPIAPPIGALVDEATVAVTGQLAVYGELTEHADRQGTLRRAAELRSVTEGDDVVAGAAPADRCRACGSFRPSSARWCTTCGAASARDGRRDDSRRQVTIVFIDLMVPEEPGAPSEAHRSTVLELFELSRRSLEHHGGIVEKFIGDTVMAVFGLDRRREDDARRAAAAALEVQAQVAARYPPGSGSQVPEVRIGVNTGPVVAGDPAAGERMVTGDAVNVAARLEQTAWPGAVVIGALTHSLLGPEADTVRLEPLTLKGKSEPVPAWRLQGLDRRRTRAAGSVELPFLGRDDELRQLVTAWRTSSDGASRRRVDLVGDAGTGKSRLLHELTDLVGDDARIVRGTCPSYGEGITFWPVIELVRDAAGLSADDDPDTARAALARICPEPRVAERLEGLLGLRDGEAPLAELFWAVRRLVEHLAAAAPLLVVIDGLHQAQPTLFDLLDELIGLGDDAPLLLVTMGRTPPPDDDTAGGGRETVHLEPLPDDTVAELISFALGHGALPEPLRHRLARAAEGLPLFVEQLLRKLIDDGLLVRTSAGWEPTSSLDDLEVPPSVEAVLAARVDALDDRERRVVDTASVIGREFGATAVAELRAEPQVADALRELGRRQLVGPSPTPGRLGDHRFRSPMTRDVTYSSLLKRTRADLHRAYADWIVEDRADSSLRELEELVGYHLERSFHLSAQVGILGGQVTEVGRRAAGHLGASARRAFARGDMPAASNLFGRAARTLPDDPTLAAELLVLGGEAAFEEGAFDEALARYDRAEELASVDGGDRWVEHARLARATQRYLTGDGDGVEAADALAAADRARERLDALGDGAGTARAWRLRSYVEMTTCQWGAAEVSARATLDAARRGGDTVLERRVLPALASFALYGPTPVPTAIDRCEALLGSIGDDRRARCLIERSLAHLLAMDGRSDEGITMCAATRGRLAELGWNFDAALVSLDLGPIHLLARDPVSAERELRADYLTLRDMGEQNYLATITSLLAEAVRQLGDADAAAALVEEAAELADEDDISAAAGWRSVRARLLTDADEPEAALPWALAAQELLAGTDELTSQAEVLADLAVLRAAMGDDEAARQDLVLAEQRYAQKGHRVGLGRCASLRVSLDGPTR
jgi:class 3 adenylate cyclase/tetratricopeptide (TPR) repeat protein